MHQAAIEQLSKLGQAACCAVHHSLQDLRVLCDMCNNKQPSSITDCVLKSDLSQKQVCMLKPTVNLMLHVA